MLAAYTPSMGNMGFRSTVLNDMQKRHIWEIGRFPAYLSDDICKELIMKNRNMLHYVSMQGGVWLMTHANIKSLLCDFSNIQDGKSQAFDFRTLQHNLIPSCNTKEPKA